MQIMVVIISGSLQHIDVMMVEFHTWLAETEDKKKIQTPVKSVDHS